MFFVDRELDGNIYYADTPEAVAAEFSRLVGNRRLNQELLSHEAVWKAFYPPCAQQRLRICLNKNADKQGAQVVDIDRPYLSWFRTQCSKSAGGNQCQYYDL